MERAHGGLGARCTSRVRLELCSSPAAQQRYWISSNKSWGGPWYKAIQSYQPNIPSEKSAPYPRANVYQGYFASLSPQPGTAPFVRGPSLPAVQPGDILAWCLGSHCQKPTSPEKADDTGVRIHTGNKTSGVGAGFVLFQTDPSGAITGFQFEQNGSMHAAAQQGIQFAVGRLVPSPSK